MTIKTPTTDPIIGSVDWKFADLGKLEYNRLDAAVLNNEFRFSLNVDGQCIGVSRRPGYRPIRLGHNATETFAKLQQAYGDSVLSRAQIFRWFKAFPEGIKSIEDEPPSDFDQWIEEDKDLRQNGFEKLCSVNRFLASKNIPVAPQPPYSPDLSPCDFFLFPKLKNHLKGHHFGTLENIQTAVTDQLKGIPISEFHPCYEEWKKPLQRCVASEDSYFEGDNV
ncbi:uncharacterized protein TNCV_2286511 [Trichonephila clavipes]|nr:uncharacterized protein TNCV_2286511 [Trichonephila clavipes]